MDHPPTNPPTHMQNLEMNRNATGVPLLLASSRKLSCHACQDGNDEAGWWKENTSTGEDTEIVCSDASPLLVVHSQNYLPWHQEIEEDMIMKQNVFVCSLHHKLGWFRWQQQPMMKTKRLFHLLPITLLPSTCTLYEANLFGSSSSFSCTCNNAGVDFAEFVLGSSAYVIFHIA